ncbi:hypothetical protein JAAARDRAFT_120957 [Jaapia argillacea MUCL 33604]|uniref:RNA-dependent RNA polymerase n=1 Tax=Jaapia argillacea MUCL 33604 TaxID=933084 RepID=A0A067QCA5_9AGAM|nr:hypothetical protein JAAARDRAFT_120957 [Jaapia argillacea MUCL 33604]
MDIFMKSISWSATVAQVEREIALVLHAPDFTPSSSIPLNFKVVLFPGQRGSGRLHSGRGKLTLPMESVGTRFLSDYGGAEPHRTIVVLNRRIQFEKSRKEPRAGEVEEIRRMPYRDLRAREEQARRTDELQSNSVSVRSLQFGWECRDGVFSPEWERVCSYPCHLTFSEEGRELRIKQLNPLETLIIAVRFSQIDWVSAVMGQSNEPVLFFSMMSPPLFESELPPILAQGVLAMQGPRFRGTIYDVSPRKRLTAFDNHHSPIAPYVSLALRVVCQSRQDLVTFRHLCKHAHGLTPTNFDYPVEHRQLFATPVLEMYNRWLPTLDWPVAFQVEALTYNLTLDVKEMLTLRAPIEELVRDHGSLYASEFLRHFRSEARILYDSEPIPPTVSDALFDCLRVTVTPTGFHLDGPFPEQSNRVMRKHPDNHDSFLRVNFVDETLLQFRFDREVDGPGFIKDRVGGALHNGLHIGGRFFQFLAYSQSALKEHAVWFVKEFEDSHLGCVNATTIIRDLGRFDNLAFDQKLIYCPARYGARVSQAFTATDASISVEAEEVLMDNDVERNGSCFTDGVGTLSLQLAREITKELRAKRRRGRSRRDHPRAFQVRFMGSKGMLSVDHTLSGNAISLRPSMIKFDAPSSLTIEIARAFDRPGKYYLNRPLIMLLEGLGVPYSVFQDLQDVAVREAQESAQSLDRAAKLMEVHGLGTSFRLPSVLHGLHKCQLDILDDDFYQQSMEFAINHVLRELKHRARIPVNEAQSWTLVGVADTHGFLQEGEIFACVKCLESSQLIFLEGDALISRSPTIHPGDVQVVRAIGRPPPGSPFEKESLPNCVVFSIHGTRSLPSMLGGGDLDGDVYNVTTFPSLLAKATYEAASYDPAPKKLLDRHSTMEDVADFVVDYINSDVLGIVATNWLIIADQSENGIFDEDCLKLAALHSDAVDYPKSGQPVPLRNIPKLKFKERPDWNAPETLGSSSLQYYQSQRAIGKLFRAIDLPALPEARRAANLQRRRLREEHEESLDELMEELSLAGEDEDDPVFMAVENHLSQLFDQYASQLQSICITHTLSRSRSAMLTEAEAVVGTIVANCSQARKRRDVMSQLREQTAALVSGIRDEISGDDDTTLYEQLERAWLAWRIAIAGQERFGAKSFWWITLGLVFDAVKDLEEEDRRSTIR